MAYCATHRYARIAPRKARLVADMIRGMKIEEAMTTLEFSKRRAAWYFKAVVRSALANAQEEDVEVHGLYVSESRVDEGPTMKRWQPKDRGRAHPIAKRTSHLYISLDER